MSSAPRWTPETKRFIFVVCAILLALAVWYFSVILAPLVVAVIIAYLLTPVVNWLSRRTPLSRGVAVPIVYISFLIILALIPSLLAPLVVQQIRQIDLDLQNLSDQFNTALNSFNHATGNFVDPESLAQQAEGSLNQIFSPVAELAATLAFGIAGGVIWAIFIFVVGYYLLLDGNRFGRWVGGWVPKDYHDEFNQLRAALDAVWKSYFLGQVILAVLVGTIIGTSTAILGIRSAILLGLVAALLELIPNWGYGVSGAVGVVFAYFQGSTWIPLPPWAFALLVGGFYFLMWQIDTNYLIPRIIGNRLQLPPAVIIIGIIAGASVGGALGLLLAAPTIATVRLLGSYIYRRLLDLEPYVLVYESPAIGGAVSEPVPHPQHTETDEPES